VKEGTGNVGEVEAVRARVGKAHQELSDLADGHFLGSRVREYGGSSYELTLADLCKFFTLLIGECVFPSCGLVFWSANKERKKSSTQPSKKDT
jgi:hypothetical protein